MAEIKEIVKPAFIQIPEGMTGYNWTPQEGDLFGVHNNRPAGHRCVWSCRWIVAGRVAHQEIKPGDWFTKEPDTDYLLAELRDYLVVLRDRIDYPTLQFTERLLSNYSGKNSERGAIRDITYRLRGNAPEFVWINNQPRNIYRLILRPGW